MFVQGKSRRLSKVTWGMPGHKRSFTEAISVYLVLMMHRAGMPTLTKIALQIHS